MAREKLVEPLMGTMWDNVVALVRTINAKSKDLSWGQSTISSVKIIFDVDFDVNVVADVGADANKLHGR